MEDMERDEQGHRVALPRLRGNKHWPAEASFNFVPPELLMVLPQLPPKLEYHIIAGRWSCSTRTPP
jgi:hypothetical protein